MSTTTVIAICITMFSASLGLIVAGFHFFFSATSLSKVMYKRMVQGLAILCMIGAAGLLEYSNYFMFTTLN